MAGTTTLETTMRNALANEFASVINTGAGTATLVFETSGDGELATCNMAATPFGAASCGVITAGTITDDSSANAGVCDHVSIEDKDGTKQAEFDIGDTSTYAFVISSTTFSQSDTIGVSTFTVTVPAS